IDNPGGGAVAVVKDLAGQVTLAAVNTYSGGTYVNRGILQANASGGLGSGPVFVRDAQLNLGANGATSSPQGVTLSDRSELCLSNTSNSGAGAYNATGDAFTLVGPGNTISGESISSGVGLNSVTRVASNPG